MEIPKVKFIYAYPFDNGRRNLYVERNLGYYPSIEEIKEKISHWEKLWSKSNKDDKIILKMIELTKRTPERSLECFVFGGGINAMSTPFLMPIMRKDKIRSDEMFIDTMIHELFHIFVSGAGKYFELVRDKYSQELVLTQNHIIIYAFLEKIYLDLFSSKPLDYSVNDLPEGYKIAVEITKEQGYENLIQEYYLSLSQF
jgi:hypothetical protein